jgi:hypothetical protein
VSVVDAPPGLGLAGVAAGEFAARRRPRRLAARVFTLVLLTSGMTIALALRRFHTASAEVLLAASIMCLCVAAVGHAVRRARLRIDADGVRWGWEGIHFRMPRDKLERIDIFHDAIAVRPKRGSTWYLSGHDWDGFDRMAGALRRAELPAEERPRRAPVTARLQSYGIVLDLLLLADAVASVFALGIAIGLY